VLSISRTTYRARSLYMSTSIELPSSAVISSAATYDFH
jgi:hypothetical protein